LLVANNIIERETECVCMKSQTKHQVGKHDGRRLTGLRFLANCIGMVLAIASIVHELRLPAERRTWHGTLFGRAPYDWRLPTPSRVREAFWRPDSRSLFQPTVFGVGWSINLAALARPFGHAK
jgi:hypothetical protein